MRKFPVRFTLTDRYDGEEHEVRAFVSQLGDLDGLSLSGFANERARQRDDYRPEIAHLYALRESVSDLKIDGKSYKIGDGSGKKKVPRYLDDDTDKTAVELLLGHVIKRNPFLVEEDRFSETFEEYRLDDEVPAEDPT